DDDTVRVEDVILAKSGSRFSPFVGIAREFTLPVAPCRHSISAPKHRPSHVVRSAAVLDPSEDERVPESPIDLSDSSKETLLEGDGEATSDRSLGRDLDEGEQKRTGNSSRLGKIKFGEDKEPQPSLKFKGDSRSN
ncbi:hypothetical protein ACLOJK_036390, partial [Asimina triloba]